MSHTLEADIEAGKFASESIANARLSPELQNRIWTLIFDTDARTKFQKLFIEKQSVEERRKRIRKMYSLNRNLYGFVRYLVSVVAEKDSDAADELVAALKGESRPAASTISDTAEGQYHQRQSSQTFSVRRFEDCEKRLKDTTWIDEWGLPLARDSGEAPILDGMSQDCKLGNREMAELKLTFLSAVYKGSLMRWNREDHQAGNYGNPRDNRTRSETGWIIQRSPNAHASNQGFGRQPSQAGEGLSEQRQWRTTDKIIHLSPAHMKVLQMGPWLMSIMPTPWVLAHRDHRSEDDSIAMHERIEFDAWLKDIELLPEMRAQIETILDEIDSQ